MAQSLKFHVAAMVLAVSFGAGVAYAADHFTDVSLSPGDAPGAWTVQSKGTAVCVVRLTGHKAGSGYGLQAPADCQGALPAGVSGWTPTANGMAMVGAYGQVLIRFERWSNSLLVSPKDSGFDLQLQRGGPNP